MDSLEIVLIIWSTILCVATFLMVLLFSDLLVERARFRAERERWLERVERSRREARYPLP